MSQSNDLINQDTLDLARATRLNNSVVIAFAALPIYEYLITLDHEVRLVWKRKTRISVPTILLVSVRLCMVVSAISTVIPVSSACREFKAVTLFQYVTFIIGYIQVAVFSASRISALCKRNIILFIVVLALGLIPAVTNIFSLIRSAYIQQPNTCVQIYTLSDTIVWELVLISRIPVIVSDVVVLTLTSVKTYEQILLSRGIGISSPLSTCIARDGVLYFVVLLIVNTLELATYRTHLGTPVCVLLANLPLILINRFMLNLRQVGNPASASNTVDPDCFLISTPRFQLSEQDPGNMDAPLNYNVPASSDECDEAYGDNV